MFARLLLRSLQARRLRLALALLSVSLGVAVATLMVALSIGVGDDLARQLRAAGPNFVVLPAGGRWPVDLGGASFQPARAGAALGDTVVGALRQTFWKNNLLAASPEMDARARWGLHAFTLVGAWFDHDPLERGERWATGIAALHPNWRIEGRWPGERSEEVALGRALAGRLGARAGDTLEIDVASRRVRLAVTGLVSTGGLDEDRAWTGLATLQRLVGRDGQVDRVWLSALVRPQPNRPAPDASRDPRGYERWQCAAYPSNVARTFHDRLTGADVLPLSEVVEGESRVVGRLDLLMVLLGLAALTASTLGMLSTTTATVVERRVEIALLRSLGASSRQLTSLLFGETLLVALAGGLLGWGAGSVAAIAVRGESFGSGAAVQPLLLPIAVLLAGAVATLGTLGPLRMAIGIEPATVLRGSA